MKKYVWLSILLVVSLPILVGCDSGGDSTSISSYDFNGRWLIQSMVTKTKVGCTAESPWNTELWIQQDQNNLMVNNQHGSANPATGSWTVTFTVDNNGLIMTWNGQMVSSEAMTGTFVISEVGGGCWAEYSFTGELLHR